MLCLLLNEKRVFMAAVCATLKFHRLQFYKDVPQFRVLCCGGDGTVGWLLDAMGLCYSRTSVIDCLHENYHCSKMILFSK